MFVSIFIDCVEEGYTFISNDWDGVCNNNLVNIGCTDEGLIKWKERDCGCGCKPDDSSDDSSDEDVGTGDATKASMNVFMMLFVSFITFYV